MTCRLLFLSISVLLLITPYELLLAQAADKNATIDTISKSIKESKAGWFKNGDLDLLSSGMIRSSTQLFSIEIGNPQQFSLPVYLMIGATADIFPTKSIANETSLIDLLNTKGGILNFGIKGNHPIKRKSMVSNFAISYHVGAKSISGINQETGYQINFFSKMVNLGLLYSSKAWQTNNEINSGHAWFNAYLSYTHNNNEKLTTLIGSQCDNNIWGLNFEGSIEVKNYLNLKFGIHRYLNNRHLSVFRDGIFKFSADFILTK